MHINNAGIANKFISSACIICVKANVIAAFQNAFGERRISKAE
jgi:hypothetical protein